MKSFLILIFTTSLISAAEPWRFDAGMFLQFPIPAGSSDLANRFTPIIGGGGNFHWWFNDKIGVGSTFSADYLSDMERNTDLVELSPLGQVNYRFSFGQKSFATFGFEAGATVHLYRPRGEWETVNKSAPVVGGIIALPFRKYDNFIVGPHAEMLLQLFKDQNNHASPELHMAVGVSVAFISSFK